MSITADPNPSSRYDVCQFGLSRAE